MSSARAFRMTLWPKTKRNLPANDRLPIFITSLYNWFGADAGYADKRQYTEDQYGGHGTRHAKTCIYIKNPPNAGR